MVLIELLILETLVIFFLAIPILGPFIKALQSLEGLAWLPLLALALLIGIFPAYGFRPECLPVSVFALIYTIVNITKQSPGHRRRTAASVPLAVIVFVLLSAVSLPMFIFSPVFSGDRDEEAEPARMLKISNPAGGDYFLRIYDNAGTDAAGDTDQPDTPPAGIIFLIPPENGSAASVDMVCLSLKKKGFTVVTYSRKGYDTPLIDENGKQRRGSPFKLLSYWHVFTGAAKYASVNERGKAQENMRRADIEFLLPYLPSPNNWGSTVYNDSGQVHQNDRPPPVLLAGYGAGGSALAYLAGENNFMSRYNNILGAVAIDSRLWSAYHPEPEKSPPPVPKEFIPRMQAGLINLFDKMKPRQVERNGPLPKAGLPVLYLVSGKALDLQKGRQPYQAVFDTLDSGSGPVALAAVESAGPLDFQDFPLTHPVYSFLLPGLKDAKKSKNPLDDTAGIIGNYANFLLERSGQTGTPKSPVNGDLFVQSKGLPGLRLQP
jgi:hypothetical protein